MNRDLPNLQQLQSILLTAAEQELLPRFNHAHWQQKADGSLVTEADIAMQCHLQEQLTQYWPDIPLLSEEMSEAEQQDLLHHSEQGLWCLDPLDGSNNFAMGLPFFSVSLALIQHNKVQLGLVCAPLFQECFSAERGRGAWLNGQPLGKHLPETPLRSGIGFIDLKRLDSQLAFSLIQHPPYSSQRSLGSVALDWCWLAAGRCHVYLHGKQKLWDYAAGSLILREAGGQALTLDGESVFRPSLEPRSTMAALDKKIFGEWRRWLEQETQAVDADHRL